MKRRTVLFVGLLLILCQLVGCQAERTPDEAEAYQSSAEKTETDEGGNDPMMPSAQRSAADHISLTKTFAQQSEWDGETLLALSEYSVVALHEESARMYPALAETLEQTKNMTVRSMEDEFDNLLSTAKEERNRLGADSFVTKTSTLDVQIRRADSVAVSLLSDSFLVYGNINDRYVNGTTYDTKTGKQLMLTDVIKDMSKIPAIVKKELTSHTWKGDLLSASAVEEYFLNTPADGIAWTLDSDGVTFYFKNGDVAQIGRNGRLAATVSFAQYPDLFEETYTAVPDSYMVELPLAHPFYTDLDGDGDPEELTVTPVLDESGLLYGSFDVYTDMDAEHYHADFSADTLYRTGGYHPYYIKTADGRHYLYVFAEGSELASRDMTLRVIDITDGTFKEAGDLHIAPGSIPIDTSYALTDPDNMMLEHFETQQQTAAYRVGSDGMPVLK
ncbi:MAG: hypothetical protein E7655_07585 [Ruminococcaceae bacterium]|nr:hypothetical protein [Oscillospiraceae bacterium]